MAIPALAPGALIFGAAASAAIAERFAPAAIRMHPDLVNPFVRVGETWATHKGRMAHRALEELIKLKPGWNSNQPIRSPDGRILRPDVRTPERVRKAGENPKSYYMEYKPDTPRGRSRAAAQVRKYEAAGVKARAIYYDPKSVK